MFTVPPCCCRIGIGARSAESINAKYLRVRALNFKRVENNYLSFQSYAKQYELIMIRTWS